MTDTPDPINWREYVERQLHAQNDDGSHVEEDPEVFHPSQLANCKRQATISKLGLEDHDAETLGTFYTGTMIHEWLEECLSYPGVEHETGISKEYDSGVKVVGRADAHDTHEDVVYDFKSRASWYKFDPPSERHLNQLTLYMDALGAEAGQVVYISKKNLEVRTWPENDTFAFNERRLDDLLAKARDLRDAVESTDIETVADVPFERCGCFVCGLEDNE